MNIGPRDALLRVALLANAAFSGVTGAALLFLPFRVSSLIGFDTPWLISVIGAGLIGFAALVATAARRARIYALSALIISGADLCWVLASAALLLARPAWLASTGVAWILGIASVVFVIAFAQILGVRRQLKETIPGFGDWRYCVAVDVTAPPVAMWRIIRDIGTIAHYMPELEGSEIRGGGRPTIGAVRACRHRDGTTWAEQCIALDEIARSFSVRFLTEEAGFPYPMKCMYGGWQVSPHRDGSRVVVWWSVTPSMMWLPGWLVVALMGASVDRSFPAVVERMSAAALGEPLPQLSSARPANAIC